MLCIMTIRRDYYYSLLLYQIMNVTFVPDVFNNLCKYFGVSLRSVIRCPVSSWSLVQFPQKDKDIHLNLSNIFFINTILLNYTSRSKRKHI